MKSCILLGSGTSVKEGIESGLWEKIKNENVWSLNWAYKTIPFLPKAELWIDIGFFTKTMTELNNLWKKGVPCYTKEHPKYKNIPEIHSFTTTRLKEQYNEKIYIGSNGLTGFFALSLACKEKYDKIYLLGYDFGVVNQYNKDGTKNKFTHYYQNKINVPSGGIGHPELYTTKDAKITDFEIYLKEPCKIYNVSPQSHITCFDRIDYITFYKLLKENNVST